MKTVSLQLFPDIGGLLVNKTDNMYNRVVFFEIESVLEFSQCCPSGVLVLWLQNNIESELNRKDMHLIEGCPGGTGEMFLLASNVSNCETLQLSDSMKKH